MSGVDLHTDERDNSEEPERPLIAVIGASSASQEVLSLAESVGLEVGARDWNLVTGGGAGVMEAACRGFRRAPGRVRGVAIGILPSEDRAFSNPFVDVSIPTGMGWARNAIITRAAWGVVAVGGETGTLSEIAFAWQMGKPIVAITGAGGWSEKLAGETLDSRRTDRVHQAASGEEALNILSCLLQRP